jgi:7,8-dihydropterin-6-yl-methyl-4-(beta-D-ribofuranosyl)aminobenzene 5'-phosphate synthase
LVRDPGQRVDPLLDDRALVLDLNRGLLVVLGCAHCRVINTIEQARKITGKDHVLAAVGGTHLGFGIIEIERLKRTIVAPKNYDLEILRVSHCTGLAASALLATEFQDKFIFNIAGKIFEL